MGFRDPEYYPEYTIAGMRSPRIAVALLLLLVLAPWTLAQAPKPVRVALVMGNATYKDAPLPNPVNDAADIARALEASGFTVIRRDNASLKEMHLALREFGDKLTRNATGLFYFAGHGLQVRGRNYLLPIDADIAREDEVAFSALDLGAVLEKLDSARNPVNLVILDACRNNPFGTRFQASAKGFAQVDAPPGTLIAFSTAPGSVASDGTGRNGLYTHHLVQEIAKAGAPVEETFKAVRSSVRRDSQGRQVPWESTSLETSFFFREAPVAIAAAEAPKPAATSGGKGGAKSGQKNVQVAAAAPAMARAAPTSLGAPPAFAIGDRWSYRVHDLLGNSKREFTLEVKNIVGDEIVYKNGSTSDLVGNPIKTFRGDKPNVHTPYSPHYVFPMKVGDVRKDIAFVQELDQRIYDATTTIRVVGEEEIEVAAGKMRRAEAGTQCEVEAAQRQERRREYLDLLVQLRRQAPGAPGGQNTTTQGKLVQHERIELVNFSLQ